MLVAVVVAVGEGVIVRGRVDFCGGVECSEEKPVCGVGENQDFKCINYNTGDQVQIDIDQTGLVTLHSIRVSLMMVQGKSAYWRGWKRRYLYSILWSFKSSKNNPDSSYTTTKHNSYHS